MNYTHRTLLSPNTAAVTSPRTLDPQASKDLQSQVLTADWSTQQGI